MLGATYYSDHIHMRGRGFIVRKESDAWQKTHYSCHCRFHLFSQDHLHQSQFSKVRASHRIQLWSIRISHSFFLVEALLCSFEFCTRFP